MITANLFLRRPQTLLPPYKRKIKLLSVMRICILYLVYGLQMYQIITHRKEERAYFHEYNMRELLMCDSKGVICLIQVPYGLQYIGRTKRELRVHIYLIKASKRKHSLYGHYKVIKSSNIKRDHTIGQLRKYKDPRRRRFHSKHAKGRNQMDIQ